MADNRENFRSWGTLSNETAGYMLRLLEIESRGEFKMTSLPGVETRKLDLELVPSEIQEVIEKRGGCATDIFIIRATYSIPMHLHDEVGEVYLGGDSFAEVVVKNQHDSGITAIMEPALFTVVEIGGSHGVEIDLNNESEALLFFGIKFEKQ